MCEANLCLPVHQDSSGKQAPARLTPCCCMECTRLEHVVVVVVCSHATTLPSPAARLACATCLKGMDGRLGIDPSHIILWRTTSSLRTLRLKLVFHNDLAPRAPLLPTPLCDGWESAKIWTSRPVPHLPFQPSSIPRYQCPLAGCKSEEVREALMRP